MGEHGVRGGYVHGRREARAGYGRQGCLRRTGNARMRRLVEIRGEGSSRHLDRCRRSVLEACLMTAREVVELIKKNSDAPFNERSYRDTFKAGNPDTTVKGIAVTMMTTFGMLKRAHAAGLNMVVTHEDTFWNDRDDTKDLTENTLYKLKTDFIAKNDMVVWRDHDNMHAMKPDYTVVGEVRSVGVKGGEDAVMAPRIRTIPETTLGEFASQVKRLTGARALRCVGDPKTKVSKILI